MTCPQYFWVVSKLFVLLDGATSERSVRRGSVRRGTSASRLACHSRNPMASSPRPQTNHSRRPIQSRSPIPSQSRRPRPSHSRSPMALSPAAQTLTPMALRWYRPQRQWPRRLGSANARTNGSRKLARTNMRSRSSAGTVGKCCTKTSLTRRSPRRRPQARNDREPALSASVCCRAPAQRVC